MKKLSHRSTHGYTIVEILIAMTITTFIAGLTYSWITKTLRTSGARTAQLTQGNDLEKQVDDLKKHFERRTNSAGSAVAVPGTAYFATGTPCTGLQITHLDPTTKTNVSTTYETVCVPRKLATNGKDPALLKLHPDLACSRTEAPVFRVTVAGQPPVDYPTAGSRVVSMAVCFRVNATGVTVEAATGYESGSELAMAKAKILLSLVDRSGGVQYLPP